MYTYSFNFASVTNQQAVAKGYKKWLYDCLPYYPIQIRCKYSADIFNILKIRLKNRRYGLVVFTVN